MRDVPVSPIHHVQWGVYWVYTVLYSTGQYIMADDTWPLSYPPQPSSLPNSSQSELANTDIWLERKIINVCQVWSKAVLTDFSEKWLRTENLSVVSVGGLAWEVVIPRLVVTSLPVMTAVCWGWYAGRSHCGHVVAGVPGHSTQQIFFTSKYFQQEGN